MRSGPHTPRTWLRRRPAGDERLALDGREVAAILGVAHGPQIGAALRWLRAQIERNPELNTTPALTALLRFAAPRRTFGSTREGVRRRRAQPLDRTRSTTTFRPRDDRER
jgi:hypothetical protein